MGILSSARAFENSAMNPTRVDGRSMSNLISRKPVSLVRVLFNGISFSAITEVISSPSLIQIIDSGSLSLVSAKAYELLKTLTFRGSFTALMVIILGIYYILMISILIISFI